MLQFDCMDMHDNMLGDVQHHSPHAIAGKVHVCITLFGIRNVH